MELVGLNTFPAAAALLQTLAAGSKLRWKNLETGATHAWHMG